MKLFEGIKNRSFVKISKESFRFTLNYLGSLYFALILGGWLSVIFSFLFNDAKVDILPFSDPFSFSYGTLMYSLNALVLYATFIWPTIFTMCFVFAVFYHQNIKNVFIWIMVASFVFLINGFCIEYKNNGFSDTHAILTFSFYFIPSFLLAYFVNYASYSRFSGRFSTIKLFLPPIALIFAFNMAVFFTL